MTGKVETCCEGDWVPCTNVLSNQDDDGYFELSMQNQGL